MACGPRAGRRALRDRAADQRTSTKARSIFSSREGAVRLDRAAGAVGRVHRDTRQGAPKRAASRSRFWFSAGRPCRVSMRCYHARSLGLHKDNCQFVCERDPDGLAGRDRWTGRILLIGQRRPDHVARLSRAVRTIWRRLAETGRRRFPPVAAGHGHGAASRNSISRRARRQGRSRRVAGRSPRTNAVHALHQRLYARRPGVGLGGVTETRSATGFSKTVPCPGF